VKQDEQPFAQSSDKIPVIGVEVDIFKPSVVCYILNVLMNDLAHNTLDRETAAAI